MAFFQYRALDKSGDQITGKLKAASREAGLQELKARQLDVFDISPVQGAAAGAKRKKGRPKPADYTRLFEQLSVFVKAGVSVLDAVDELRATVPHAEIEAQLEKISIDLRKGENLSDSLAEHMPAVPDYGPPLLKMAEATGQLATVLRMIADQMSRADNLRKTISSALNYPLFLVGAGVFAVCFIFYFVVPRFATMIRGNEEKLPAFTRTVFELGLGFRENVGIVLATLFVLLSAGIFAFRNDQVRLWFSQLTYQLPLIGGFRKMIEQGTWLRVLGLSLESGARLLQALQLATDAAVTPARRHGYQDLIQTVRGGMDLTESIQLNLDIDPLAVNLISTGQKTGQLSDMVLTAADIYDEDIKTISDRLTALAEPIAIVTISAIIGGVVIALVTAMTSIYDIAL